MPFTKIIKILYYILFNIVILRLRLYAIERVQVPN